MSLNDVFRRSIARQLEHAGLVGQFLALKEAADVAKDAAAFLRAKGPDSEEHARACEAIELILRERAQERLAKVDHCATCGAVIMSHVHLSHCADGPERPCGEASSCSLSDLLPPRGNG